MSLVVRAEPLSAGRFAPFGDVVWAGLGDGVSANHGTAVRFNHAAALVNARSQAGANLAVFRSVGRELPLDLEVLEQHPHSTQLFAPLITTGFLVVVAPTRADGGPDVAGTRAFLCGPGQGVNYRPGVWHHGIVSLGTTSDFLMLAWEDGTPGDCVEERLLERLRIER